MKAALSRYRQDAGGKAPGAVWEIRSPAAGQVLRVAQESENVVVAGSPILAMAGGFLRRGFSDDAGTRRQFRNSGAV